MSKIKLNLNFYIKDLEDEDIETQKAHTIIGNTMAGSGLDPNKNYDAGDALALAIDLVKNPEIEVTISQFRMIETMIKDSNLNILTRGRLENYLKTIKV